MDRVVGSVGLVVGGRVAGPGCEPVAEGGDVIVGELVGRELLVVEPVELSGCERGVLDPQAAVAGERQLEQLPAGVAVESSGDVDEVARQRPAEQGRGLGSRPRRRDAAPGRRRA